MESAGKLVVTKNASALSDKGLGKAGHA